jgi:hypothetical protein
LRGHVCTIKRNTWSVPKNTLLKKTPVPPNFGIAPECVKKVPINKSGLTFSSLRADWFTSGFRYKQSVFRACTQSDLFLWLTGEYSRPRASHIYYAQGRDFLSTYQTFTGPIGFNGIDVFAARLFSATGILQQGSKHSHCVRILWAINSHDGRYIRRGGVVHVWRPTIQDVKKHEIQLTSTSTADSVSRLRISSIYGSPLSRSL